MVLRVYAVFDWVLRVLTVLTDFEGFEGFG